MSEFTRGTLLGRFRLDAADGAHAIYTATIQTEVMLILSPSIDLGGAPHLSVYHSVSGLEAFDFASSVVWNMAVSQADGPVLFASPGAGPGIHMLPTDVLAVELVAGTDTSEINVSVYGVTATLQPIR